MPNKEIIVLCSNESFIFRDFRDTGIELISKWFSLRESIRKIWSNVGAACLAYEIWDLEFIVGSFV
jgi:hypothetical protein